MPLDNPSPEVSGNERYAFTVNGTRHWAHGAIKDGRELLETAALEPASDYVLVRLTRPGSIAIGLDEEVDLGQPGHDEFRAFLSDRSFNFTIDERGYVWGAPTIAELELRDLSGTPEAKIFLLEREDGPDRLIEPGTVVDLAEQGTEHIRTGKRLVTVYYGDDVPFELERRFYTGAELATTFGVPAGYVLDLVKHDGEFKEIGPNEKIRPREGMHFVSHPPCGQSS